jgi:hypothetical protein
MVKGHPEILLDAELNPSRIQQITVDLMKSAYSRINPRPVGGGTVRQGPMDSEVLLYFFLGAIGDARRNAMSGVSSSYYYQFLNAQYTTAKLSASPPAVPFRKLYVAWLENERYPLVMRRALDIAGRNGVKECMPTALKLASEQGIAPAYRASALIAFARLADKENIKDLTPFFEDNSAVSTVIVNKDRATVQMRDVALGAAIQLAGIDPTEFGFIRRPVTTSITSYTSFAFGSDEKRDAAHAKWKEWADKNLKK